MKLSGHFGPSKIDQGVIILLNINCSVSCSKFVWLYHYMDDELKVNSIHNGLTFWLLWFWSFLSPGYHSNLGFIPWVQQEVSEIDLCFCLSVCFSVCQCSKCTHFFSPIMNRFSKHHYAYQKVCCYGLGVGFKVSRFQNLLSENGFSLYRSSALNNK